MKFILRKVCHRSSRLASPNATVLGIRSSQELYTFSREIANLLKGYIYSVYHEGAQPYYPVYCWSDDFSYAASGIPVVDVRGRDPLFLTTFYHTQFDTLDKVSREAMYVSLIVYGVYAIRLDRALVLPYDFTVWARDLAEKIDREALLMAGLDPKPLIEALKSFHSTAERQLKLANELRDLVTRGVKVEKKSVDLANKYLLATAKILNSRLTTLGGHVPEDTLYPHEQYQSDFTYLRKVIRALEIGDVDVAISSLEGVAGMSWGKHVSYEVFRYHLLNRVDPSRTDLFWATGRLATYVDVYHDYYSLVNKKVAGITNYISEIMSLRMKIATVVDNLRESVTKIIGALEEATQALDLAIKSLLYAMPAEIALVHATGVSSVTIVGKYFSPNSRVMITWDGELIPTVPSPLITNEEGSFVAIISVPTQVTPGLYVIAATDEEGETATARFTVIDVRGPQGPQGPQGPPGEPAPLGYLVASLALSIAAIVIAVLTSVRRLRWFPGPRFLLQAL
ncbi:MAG: hypothetical protein QXK88_06825 [Desulfurococcaceae archaeon]